VKTPTLVEPDTTTRQTRKVNKVTWTNKRLPNSRKAPPGLERVILRKLPLYLIGGTLAPVLANWGWRTFMLADPIVSEAEKSITMANILTVSIVITAWTAVFTVAIGCAVVVVMKGHGYVADAYPLSDAEKPKAKPSVEDQR
jgi:hypothetical protein